MEVRMNTDRVTARNPLDVRIILAVLWVAGMLSSLNGDTYRLSDPVALQSLLANTGPIVASSGLLSAMSALLVGHILMSALTLMLKPSASRWANRIIGVFYAVIVLVFWVLVFVLGSPTGYAIVWATAQLVFALLVVWYAWKWINSDYGKPQTQPKN
jgi:hypothetical protein